MGAISLSKNTSVYINVGGAGKHAFNTEANCRIGGYNGGGNLDSCGQTIYGNGWSTTGGGATHIASRTGVLSSLSSYQSSVLIVAGGGGGVSCWTDHAVFGGHGGGYVGVSGIKDTAYGAGTGEAGQGGTQTSAGSGYASGSFGRGGNGYGDCGGSGGGGWYGGGGAQHHSTAGGGSGYIGNSSLVSGGGITKHMTCYSCSTSTAAATRTNSNTNTATATATADRAKTGNGYARITWLGSTL